MLKTMDVSMLDLALQYARRGWHVFPCWPKTKQPMTRSGWKEATTDEETIRKWWTRTPEANIAIAAGYSNLAVVDIDHGLENETSLSEWAAGLPDSNEPPTFAVRTGRRPEFGVQLYFQGAIPDVGLWRANGCEGQVKSLGGYVMAAGSVHPSGERYEVLADEPVQATPEWVRDLKKSERAALSVVAGKKIPEGAGRHHAMTSIAGGLRAKGLEGEAIYEALIPLNPAMCEVPLSDEALKEIAYGVARRYAPNEPEPEVRLGGKKAEALEPEAAGPVDWRSRYHTHDETENAPPVDFLIDGFMACDSITALAAPVAQRKTLIALNVVHALCTGEPLFGHFEVKNKPKRVIYLCPEMGLRSFADRLKRIGLLPYVGDTLFFRTMSMEDHLSLEELTVEELEGAVVVLDTAVRFIEGDENSSEHMRQFAKSVFRLKQLGGTSSGVLVLFHSLKGTKESSELSLENAMRGSGELGAFVTSCWATRLQDPEDPYGSASFLTNVKQRDFESKPFEVTSDSTCRMTLKGEIGDVKLQARNVFKGDKDGKDAAALAIVKANMGESIRDIVKVLAEHDIKRSKDWVQERKVALKGTGSRRTDG